MDIDYLSKMVGELILDNDEVSLPGVGSFVAELMPATFSDKGYVINPPYRRLSFRQRLECDNLLIHRYAAEASLTTEQASAELRPFLKELKEVLKEKKVIIFPGLGRLRATKENNFFFVPEESLDIYPEGCLLEPVSLKNHTQTKEELSAAVSSLGRLIDERLRSSAAETAVAETAAAEPASASVEPAPAEPALASVEPAPASEPVPAVEPLLPPIEIEPMPEPAAPAVPSSEPAGPAEAETPAEPEIPVAQPAAPVQAPEPAGAEKPAAPAAQSAETPAETEAPALAAKKHWWRYAAIAAAAVLAFFLLFILLSRIAPGLTDHLLYTKDELYIINYPLP